MAYQARTLTGRIALAFGVTKKAVRDTFFVAVAAIVLIAVLLGMLART